MARVYVGNLDPRVTERDLEDEFRTYGVLRRVWVARKPPGYAFVDFDDRRDAQDAIRGMDGKNGWRVELSHKDGGDGGGGRGRGGGGRGRGGSELECYECGETGHFARECRSRIGSGGSGSGRHRSRSPISRRSPGYGRRRYSPLDRSPKRRSYSSRDRSPKRRSYSPLDRSPRRRSVSPPRGRNYIKSPPQQRHRNESPYAIGNLAAEDAL